MRMVFFRSGKAAGFALFPTAALAAPEQEQVLTFLTGMILYGLVFFAIVVAVFAYFMRFRDKRRTPVETLLDAGEAIHSVRPDSSVTECVRMMEAEKIGALIVMDGESLAGIFTERDALNKVLAAGLDPGSTKVSDVMTRNPHCIEPTTTVGEAMKLVTQRRFRHMPIVKNGKVLAVVSSGDLTHWLVKEQTGEVQELVDLAAQS